uniref:hypothetical protein n=1 Tax=Virgibacillus salexigens TaxID=61016 RepID=UPI00190DF877
MQEDGSHGFAVIQEYRSLRLRVSCSVSGRCLIHDSGCSPDSKQYVYRVWLQSSDTLGGGADRWLAERDGTDDLIL